MINATCYLSLLLVVMPFVTRGQVLSLHDPFYPTVKLAHSLPVGTGCEKQQSTANRLTNIKYSGVVLTHGQVWGVIEESPERWHGYQVTEQLMSLNLVVTDINTQFIQLAQPSNNCQRQNKITLPFTTLTREVNK